MGLTIRGGGVLFYHRDPKGELFVFVAKRSGTCQSFSAHLADRRRAGRHMFPKSVFKAFFDRYNKGTWSVLGGGMDEKDHGDFKACAYREAIEESMWNSRVEAAIARFDKGKCGEEHFVWYNQVIFRWLNVMIPVGDMFPIELTPGEFSEGKWARVSELRDELHPYLLRALERLRSIV
jgi:hypothetical protein